jgi:hypothetical protein
MRWHLSQVFLFNNSSKRHGTTTCQKVRQLMTDVTMQTLYSQIEQLQTELAEKSWIADNQVKLADTSSAADLFDDHDHRPLVVGLFGGTGAGKSSLLNRLAGDEIARTGVVRPTSMEITAYLHQDKKITALPTGFPQQNFSSVSHSSEVFADVMWVDMPDFDSEETQNRDQVVQWLPYIDLLIYVVTPERYRDAEGWRLLQSHGYRHGWLFVMNQWDKAEAIQLSDFRELLQSTGFENPKIFKTSCAVPDHNEDEFDALSTLVATMSEHNAVQQLEQFGWLHRLNTAEQQLSGQLPMLGEHESGLRESFDQHWSDFTAEVTAGSALAVREYSERFAAAERSPVKTALNALRGTRQSDGEVVSTQRLASEASSLWSDWSTARLKDTLSRFQLAEQSHGVPALRIAAAQPAESGVSDHRIGADWQQVVSQSVANPGLPWQRTLHSVCRWLQWLLPLAVVCWIAYRVFDGFIDGAADRTAYVGVDLLVNGLMLTAIAWLIPAVASHFLKPSVPKSVERALTGALQQDLDSFAAPYRAALERVAEERRQLQGKTTELLDSTRQMQDRFSVLKNSEIDNLLMRR